MPKFDYNPVDAVAGFPVFPKGEYKFELGEPKTFYFKSHKEDKPDSFGVAYPAKCTEVLDGEPKMVGKKAYFRLFQHSVGGRDFAKPTQMAALGFTPGGDGSAEAEFNEKYGGKDWGFNTDDNTIGEGWHLLKGQSIIKVIGTPKLGENGNLNTNEVGVRPI